MFRLAATHRELVPELAEALVPDTRRLVNASFRDQVTPEGAPWPEKKDGEPLRLDRLKGNLAYDHDAQSVRVTVSPPLSYHQNTDRSFLPKKELPPAWKKSYEDEVRKLIRRKLKGG